MFKSLIYIHKFIHILYFFVAFLMSQIYIILFVVNNNNNIINDGASYPHLLHHTSTTTVLRSHHSYMFAYTQYTEMTVVRIKNQRNDHQHHRATRPSVDSRPLIVPPPPFSFKLVFLKIARPARRSRHQAGRPVKTRSRSREKKLRYENIQKKYEKMPPPLIFRWGTYAWDHKQPIFSHHFAINLNNFCFR